MGYFLNLINFCLKTSIFLKKALAVQIQFEFFLHKMNYFSVSTYYQKKLLSKLLNFDKLVVRSLPLYKLLLMMGPY